MQPSKQSIISGYVAQALNIGYGVLILPFMLIYLSSAEVAYWLIMLSFLGLVMVFDFGFSPAITRNVAYVMAGATKLQAQGIAQESTTGQPNWALYGQLYKTVKQLYLWIAVVGLVLFGGLGSWYVSLFLTNTEVNNGWIVWAIFLLGFIVNLYFLYTQPMLMGLGRIHQANMVNIIMRSAWLILSAVGLWWYESILVLPVAYLIGVVVARFYAYTVLNKEAVSLVSGSVNGLFDILLPNAWRLGVVMLGAFLINKATIFIAGVCFVSEVSASYIVTLQVLAVIMAVANVYFQMHVPQLSGLHLATAAKKKALYYKLIMISLTIYIVSSLLVLMLGNDILAWLNAKVGLLPLGLLLLVLLFGALELHHSLAATYITTQNQVPFLWASILSGLAIVLLPLAIFYYAEESQLLWLILIQGFVQLAYNNWKWPYCVYMEFKS